jgi:hypothetical protein
MCNAGPADRQILNEPLIATLEELSRSIGPCKKYGFLGLLTRARGGRGPPGGPPEPSVCLPGTPGGLAEAPGT